MISFGELRKLSLQWQTDISTVERIYALDWLLKGIFDRASLQEFLILRGASALSQAYFADYPRVQDVDLARAQELDIATLEREVEDAVQDAARVSGLQFRLHSFQPTEARVEFTGPLGRRSAAQPLIPLHLVAMQPRIPAASRPLIHPFSDECRVTVRAVALEELVAERIVLWSQKPRARDVYDLWFILTRGTWQLDRENTRVIAQTIANEKRVALRAELDPAYTPLLERAWENVLKEVRGHPSLAEARTVIQECLQ